MTVARLRGHARLIVAGYDEVHIRQAGIAAQRLEDRHDARRRVVPVEEYGAVVCEVERTIIYLHALAVHGAVVVAYGNGAIDLRELDASPWLHHIVHDRAPIPASVSSKQRGVILGGVSCCCHRPC